MPIREKHLVSDFIVYKRKNSSITPGKQISYVFCCPVCSTEQSHEPAHGEHETCEAKCGASWIAHGNLLDLTF